MTSVLSFLGGSAFRAIWGEISSWVNKRQDHKYEIERMRLEAEIAAAQHERQQDAIKLQAQLGIQVIEAQSVADVELEEAKAWSDVVSATSRKSGVAWTDAWNAAIRPGGATWAVLMLSLDAFALAQVGESTAQVCFAFLGIFVADRTLGKREK